MALPDFGLPQAIEAFDGVLHAVLKGRHEYRNDTELQTQPTDAPNGIDELVGALKHRVVIKLRILRQAVTLPALHQAAGSGLRVALAHDPTVGQFAMQTLGRKQVDQRTVRAASIA
jgi:hypothetical protein